jgi:hypothetical protein
MVRITQKARKTGTPVLTEHAFEMKILQLQEMLDKNNELNRAMKELQTKNLGDSQEFKILKFQQDMLEFKYHSITSSFRY